MTNVPLLDLKAQFAKIRAEVMPLIEQVCTTQQFILGEHVRGLEEEIARYCGTPFAVGVSSGTDALLLALMALGIGAGDEVVTSPFTFFATAGTIARLGARPVFCDIDPITFNMSPSAVQTFIERDCITTGDGLINRATRRRIKAIMPVHLYGQSADMDGLMEIAGRRRNSQSANQRAMRSNRGHQNARASGKSSSPAKCFRPSAMRSRVQAGRGGRRCLGAGSRPALCRPRSVAAWPWLSAGDPGETGIGL